LAEVNEASDNMLKEVTLLVWFTAEVLAVEMKLGSESEPENVGFIVGELL